MKRWNGWGDDTIDYPLPEKAQALLHEWVGELTPPEDATRADVLAQVPNTRLPAHPLISRKEDVRLDHARGQSLPDMVAMRSGRVGYFPDGVAQPENDDQLAELIRFALETEAHLIPYGGGTSVVGHINPLPRAGPTVTVNLQRLNRLRQFNKTSGLATFGAGVQGPDLEAQLRAHGFTLGHYPQSFELSTLGGWIATRSSGQQSLGYGRIEDLFAGGTLLAPAGRLEMPPFPASAAGPDLRQLILGSEGRMGIISEATVRVTPLPEREDFHAVFFPDFDHGLAAVHTIAQTKLPLSMLRLSTAVETQTTLALAGHERLIGTLEKMLAVRGVDNEKCMMLFGVTGNRGLVKSARKEALHVTGQHQGIHVGRQFGRQWRNGRFRTPYLRNALWETGVGVDTLETAISWDHVPALMASIEASLRAAAAEFEEKIHVFTHLSHVYSQGASIYTTYLFRLQSASDQTLTLWRALKAAASQAIVAMQGTISHQHGVGTDHAAYLQAEKGVLGMAVLADIIRHFDPSGVMNPGKLL